MMKKTALVTQNHTVIQKKPNISRRYFSQQRRQLTRLQKQRYAKKASRYLYRLIGKIPNKANIGIYYDDFGELPTEPILQWCLQHGYQAYLPITGTYGHCNRQLDKRLRFAPIWHTRLKNIPTHRHSLGMKQPQSRLLKTANQLDVLFLPLIAVDKTGKRMGMGGGFYDYTLANCRRKPLKIAWCYDFQVVDKLQANPWDIAVDIIMTPHFFYRCDFNQ